MFFTMISCKANYKKKKNYWWTFEGCTKAFETHLNILEHMNMCIPLVISNYMFHHSCTAWCHTSFSPVSHRDSRKTRSDSGRRMSVHHPSSTPHMCRHSGSADHSNMDLCVHNDRQCIVKYIWKKIAKVKLEN